MTKLFTHAIASLVVVAAVVVVAPVSVHAQDSTPSDTLTVAPTEPPLPPPVDPPHVPVTYTVGQYFTKQLIDVGNGVLHERDTLVTEDLDYIANKFNLTTDEIKYSNPDVAQLKAGDKLTLPPIHGVVYKVQEGDTLTWIADSYQVAVDAIAQYNNITDADIISPDQVLIIPGAKLPPLPPPTPVYTTMPRSGNYSPPSNPVPYSGGNHFSFGYCTWWVANQRPIPWFGDAWQWWGNARASGYAEGSTPRAGAILVTWEGPVGHVAYVTSVNSDGSYTISEMNYNAWDVVDYRNSSQVHAVVGFIY